MVASGVLGLFALDIATQGLDQLAEGGQQRLQKFDKGLVVAAGPVGQAEHADQLAIGMDGQTGKGLQQRGGLRRAGRLGRCARHITQQRTVAVQRLFEQFVEVWRRLVCAAQVAGGLIADGIGAQIGRALAVVEHFADQAELAVAENEDALEQGVEGFALILRVDIGRLGLGDYRQQLARLLALPMLGL